MHETADINPEPGRKDAALLLENFLSGQDREAAFGVLVQTYGGLVYSSALRRTCDPQLAEEVAQNVFGIIARKAASLRKHPALMAWIFKTTQFESSKAMRAERRRQRKHDALALESSDDEIAPETEAAWRAAVPLLDESLDDLSEKDRQIVLQRFFEERKFKEIAQDSGRSEAACKMQLKRALGRLSKLLSKRGVALSAAAIASGLATELTHAAPAKALAAIAPKALAASTQLGAASTITTISVQTMSTIKTATITGAAVVAVASAPFLWQQSNAKNLQGDLSELETQRLALAEQLSAGGSAGNAVDRDFAADAPPTRTVQDLLRASDEPIDVDTLLKSMMDVMMTQDIVGMIRVLLPISNLAPDEYDELIKAIEEHKGHGQMKQMALQMLGSFAPSEDPQKSIERLMTIGVEPHSYSDLLANWGSRDPEAALAWYREREAAGAFVSKGINDHYEGYVLSELIGGIGKKDPQQALELFKENRGADKWNRMSSSLARSFGKLMRKGGDDGLLRELLAAVSDSENGSDASNMIQSAASTAVPGGDLDGRMNFAKEFLDDPEDRMRVAVNFSSHSANRPVAERADWLLENTPAELQAEAIGDLIRTATGQDSESASEWVRQQTGVIRDSGLRSIAELHSMRGRNRLAFEHAQQIADEESRDKALDKVALQWVRLKPDEASEALPAELVEKHRPAPAAKAPAEFSAPESTQSN